jgi:hypothetical protein
MVLLPEPEGAENTTNFIIIIRLELVL